MEPITRQTLEALDAQDPLAHYRDQFILPEGVIYLDGNSLGALPKATAQRVASLVTKEWGAGLIRSWNDADWIGAPARIGNKIARLIGAEAGEVIVADSTSVNIFKSVMAALSLDVGRNIILTERGNFPTDHYILQGIEALLPGRVEVRAVERSEIMAAIGDDTLLVVLTHVHYRSGEVFDMKGVSAQAHNVGALVLWDLCHSVGAMPVDLGAADVDFAVGCGYKFLNGGPGAPSFIFVAKRLQDKAVQPLTGWFGHSDPFAFEEDFRPARGIERFQVGTPAMLSMAALEVGVDVFEQVDMGAVREQSLHLGSCFIQLMEQRCSGLGFELVCPREEAVRGSQVAFRHEKGYPIMRALIERGVIGDFRAPDVMRFGMTPLYLRYVDILDAVEILSDVMATSQWQKPEYNIKQGVT